jgi:cell wall-associated NlpC family hydrolase
MCVPSNAFQAHSKGVNMFEGRGFFQVCLPLVLMLGGCVSVPAPQHSSAGIDTAQAPSRLSLALASEVTLYAVGLVGTPYRYGGNTPDSGFDCSGLIAHVYQSRAGVAPPRTVEKLNFWGQSVASENIRSGDLVLFAQSNVATHAGIYVGEGRFVHAPSTGGEVRLDRLNSKYWASQQVAFRRP